MIAARLAKPVKRIGYYHAMWAGPCGEWQFHTARRMLGIRKRPPDLRSTKAHGWPGVCERCGVSIDWTDGDVASSGTKIVWDTPSGDLEPGCLYWGYRSDVYVDDPPDPDHYCSWSNCDGRHLYAVLPNGHHWDIDSRARNCGLPQDHTHRCWCRHGEPPNVTVDKACSTCNAGAGSILAGDYHGFLQNGQFT
jgi:hypothetical protein